jgi:hypothetical protein
MSSSSLSSAIAINATPASTGKICSHGNEQLEPEPKIYDAFALLPGRFSAFHLPKVH